MRRIVLALFGLATSVAHAQDEYAYKNPLFEDSFHLPVTPKDTVLALGKDYRILHQVLDTDFNKDGLKDWAFILLAPLQHDSVKGMDAVRDASGNTTYQDAWIVVEQYPRIVGVYFCQPDSTFKLAAQANRYLSRLEAESVTATGISSLAGGGGDVQLAGTKTGCLDFTSQPQGSGSFETTERFRYQQEAFRLIGVTQTSSAKGSAEKLDWNVATGQWVVTTRYPGSLRKPTQRKGQRKPASLPKLQSVRFDQTMGVYGVGG